MADLTAKKQHLITSFMGVGSGVLENLRTFKSVSDDTDGSFITFVDGDFDFDGARHMTANDLAVLRNAYTALMATTEMASFVAAVEKAKP